MSGKHTHIHTHTDTHPHIFKYKLASKRVCARTLRTSFDLSCHKIFSCTMLHHTTRTRGQTHRGMRTLMSVGTFSNQSCIHRRRQVRNLLHTHVRTSKACIHPSPAHLDGFRQFHWRLKNLDTLPAKQIGSQSHCGLIKFDHLSICPIHWHCLCPPSFSIPQLHRPLPPLVTSSTQESTKPKPEVTQ